MSPASARVRRGSLAQSEEGRSSEGRGRPASHGRRALQLPQRGAWAGGGVAAVTVVTPAPTPHPACSRPRADGGAGPQGHRNSDAERARRHGTADERCWVVPHFRW